MTLNFINHQNHASIFATPIKSIIINPLSTKAWFQSAARMCYRPRAQIKWYMSKEGDTDSYWNQEVTKWLYFILSPSADCQEGAFISSIQILVDVWTRFCTSKCVRRWWTLWRQMSSGLLWSDDVGQLHRRLFLLKKCKKWCEAIVKKIVSFEKCKRWCGATGE